MTRSILFFALLISGLSAQVKVSIPEGEQIPSETYSTYHQIGNTLSLFTETSDTIQVKIAFDTEYTIGIENFDQYRRVLAKVRIDGSEATDDGLILRINEIVNLERFVNSKTLQSGKRFKFIERNAALADGHRSNSEDGLIVITVQFEERAGKLVEYKATNPYQGYLYAPYRGTIDSVVPIWRGWNNSTLELSSQTCINASNVDLSPGVTVEGSVSSQRFQEEKVGELEDRIDQIVIRLMGYYKDPPVLLRKGN